MENTQQAVLQAVQDTVKRSPLSKKELAGLMGLGHQTFLNKVNPNMEKHHLSLLESIALQLITKDFSIQSAVNAILDHEGHKQEHEPKHILQAVLNVNRKVGGINKEIDEALDDYVITPKELTDILSTIRTVRESLDLLEASVLSHK